MADYTPQGRPATDHRHEGDGIVLSRVLLPTGLLVATAVVLHVALWWLMGFFAARPPDALQPPSPLAQRPQMPPEPRLEIAPKADLHAWRAREETLPNAAIERAKNALVRRGLPTRGGATGGR